MTHKLSWLLGAALAMLPATVVATPVSLDCHLISSKDGERTTFEIQLNEDTESASYTLKSGKLVRWRALFTPGQVVFGDGSFTIDRTTLGFTRRNIFGSVDLGTDNGKCSVMTTKRAF